jgi:hypothetical protein
MKLHRLVYPLGAALGLALAGCGGGNDGSYHIPVDHPLIKFQKQSEAELTSQGSDLDLTKPMEEEAPEHEPAPPPPPPVKPAPPPPKPATPPAPTKPPAAKTGGKPQ